MKKHGLLIGFFAFIIAFNILIGISGYVHKDSGLQGNYLKLIPPPPEALAVSYGTPLSTVDIGLFAYYKHSSWDLSDCIPAFLNYTQYSNYIDGYVRVYGNVKGTTFIGSDYGHSPPDILYIDVQVRVRSDGWILSWLTDSQSKALILCWGDDVKGYESEGNPIDAIDAPDDYYTCLGRAIHRVYHNAGVSWVGYDELFYYDYEFPDATRLYIFGDFTQIVFPDAEFNEEYFFFIVPDTVTIEEAIMCYAGSNSDGDDIDIDGVDRASISAGVGIGWRTLDISGYLSEGTRHEIHLENGGSQQGSNIACGVIMWTS